MSASVAHSNRKRKEGKRNDLANDGASVASSAPRNSLATLGEEEIPMSKPEGFWKYQQQVFDFYKRPSVEYTVAFIITANFFTNIIEKQIDPGIDQKFPDTWSGLSDFYNVIFLIELLVNMYGSWCWVFWNDGWNVFDFVVVILGFLDLCRIDLPGPLGLLRLMRAFRVFRLFKRVESLRKILVSIARAVPGMLNAFLILLIVMAIYAILAVELFQFQDSYTDAAGNKIEYVTGRGNPYGDEYFGNFFKSLFTMFQVLTGESWSEAIARPLLNNINRDDRSEGATGERKWNINGAMSAVFFVSFQLLCSVVLINVVVAVLLEKMVDPTEPDDLTPEDEGETVLRPRLSGDAQVYPDLQEDKDDEIKVDPSTPTPSAPTSPSETERRKTMVRDTKEKLATISRSIDSFKEDMLMDIQTIRDDSKHADDTTTKKMEEIRSILSKLTAHYHTYKEP